MTPRGNSVDSTGGAQSSWQNKIIAGLVIALIIMAAINGTVIVIFISVVNKRT